MKKDSTPSLETSRSSLNFVQLESSLIHPSSLKRLPTIKAPNLLLIPRRIERPSTSPPRANPPSIILLITFPLHLALSQHPPQAPHLASQFLLIIKALHL